MSNNIVIKRSAVPGRVPTILQCAAGELAANTQDEKLYFGTGNAVHEIAKKSDLIASTSDHGALTGLADDDHAQYVHIDIPRTISAKHTFSPATATAPFTLSANAQGQKVNGLNADLLDGFDSTSFVLNSVIGVSVATLGGDGKLSANQVPAIAITDTYVISTEAAMLALAATVGTVAIRTDLNTSYILAQSDATILSHWQELISPTANVTSVNGQVGAVTLHTGDIEETANLFFTVPRARAALSASGDISYNSTTGAFSYTSPVTSVAGKSGGAVLLNKNDVDLSNVDNKSSVTIRSELTAGNVTAALGYTPQDVLGFTPENVSGKNTANGYAGLDANAKLNASAFSSALITDALGFIPQAELGFTPEDSANKNVANGYVGLGADLKIASQYLPSSTVSPIDSVFSGNVGQQTGTSLINVSTTAPTTAMGTQVVSQAVVPKTVTEKTIIEFAGMVDSSANNSIIHVAVFRGTTFIGMQAVYMRTAGQMQPFALKIVDVSGVTTSVTYSIRIGTTAGTWYLGRGSVNTYGGVNPSGWTITQLN